MTSNQSPDGLKRALTALYSREPLTDAHRAEHKRLVARQIARDEAKRNESTQAELLDGIA